MRGWAASLLGKVQGDAGGPGQQPSQHLQMERVDRRAAQLIGRVVVLDQAIANGVGRARIDDAFWVVAGPDLPAGSRVRVVAVDGMTLKVQDA